MLLATSSAPLLLFDAATALLFGTPDKSAPNFTLDAVKSATFDRAPSTIGCWSAFTSADPESLAIDVGPWTSCTGGDVCDVAAECTPESSEPVDTTDDVDSDEEEDDEDDDEPLLPAVAAVVDEDAATVVKEPATVVALLIVVGLHIEAAPHGNECAVVAPKCNGSTVAVVVALLPLPLLLADDVFDVVLVVVVVVLAVAVVVVVTVVAVMMLGCAQEADTV